MLERSMEAIEALQMSNDMKFMMVHDELEDKLLPPSLLKPTLSSLWKVKNAPRLLI